MEHFSDLNGAAAVLDALGSEIRRTILIEIAVGERINLDTLARRVHLTNGAITKHIKLLKQAGIIEVDTVSGKRGTQKQCSLKAEKLSIALAVSKNRDKTAFSLPLGQFCECDIQPYCGMASHDGLIGLKDEPEYFTYPQRAKACALWFKSGHLSYTLPDVSRLGRPKEITLSFEIASKAAGYGSKSASATFYLDGLPLFSSMIDGEFSDRRGVLTPPWYDSRHGQYGKYLTIKIDSEGVYLDGEKKSEEPLSRFKLKTFTVAGSGGLMLFGSRFGDYDADIEYRVLFDGE